MKTTLQQKFLKKLLTETIVPTYKIVRFYHPSQNKENEDVAGMDGLTLEEAQEYCEDEDTREDGVYFDGYTEE